MKFTVLKNFKLAEFGHFWVGGKAYSGEMGILDFQKLEGGEPSLHIQYLQLVV